MVVKPLFEDLDGLLGQVAAAFAGHRGPADSAASAVGAQLLGGGVLVRRRAGVAFTFSNDCNSKEKWK